ncbi:MAG: hypothetical protein ACJ8C4_16645 [Gemmataceae bacterium]
MRKCRVVCAICVVGWLAACGIGAADKGPWKAVVPEKDADKLISTDVELVKETVAQGLSDKKSARKAKATALLIAGYAQSAMLSYGTNAGRYALLRDRAIAVAQAITDGKTAESRKLAAELSRVSSAGGAKTEAVDLAASLDLDTLMSSFRPESRGGRGWEAKLKKLEGKRSLSSDDVKDSMQLGYQCAVIAQFTESLAPAADEGKKKKADWIKWSREMGENALAVSKAAGAAKPDEKIVRNALKKLDDSCTRCHAVFRD